MNPAGIVLLLAIVVAILCGHIVLLAVHAYRVDARLQLIENMAHTHEAIDLKVPTGVIRVPDRTLTALEAESLRAAFVAAQGAATHTIPAPRTATSHINAHQQPPIEYGTAFRASTPVIAPDVQPTTKEHR